ncbi:hypothetical protein E1193_11750 [Micromonospora sp. KC606]|uniref:hypothetical protein n=1 Tax=Micromonospora sp. KC606 TaxID=2530379 RepID=UPI0010493AAD|nr:hypothetical protein [Micromonospora sp. KC606]TDC82417.1 hypothetical protein E1193_11750 [Micromonospora sp. KC606]
MILPDCTICGGRVVATFNAGGPVEMCQGCGNAARPITAPINVADLREQIATVVEARPVLCDACVVKRCMACETPGCDCPRSRHPRRPAGDLTAEGMELLAAERKGHLEPCEVAR